MKTVQEWVDSFEDQFGFRECLYELSSVDLADFVRQIQADAQGASNAKEKSHGPT